MKSVRAALAASVLNEVLYGLPVRSFEEDFGTSKDDLKALRKRAVSASAPNEHAAIALNQEQAVAMSRVLTRTLKEIGPEEFETRTGFPYELGLKENTQLGQN